MKKFLFALLMGFAFYGNAYAGSNHDCKDCYARMERKGGFVDDTVKPVKLSEIANMQDDAYVTIEGYIVKRIGDEEYTFSDGKNNITVEIDNKVWRGLTVTPKDRVLINGKVDKDFTSTSIEAKSISIVD